MKESEREDKPMRIIPMVSTHKWHIVGYPQWLCLGTTVPISVGIID